MLNIKINKEDGRPAISYNNVLTAMDLHGKLIGAIHAVVPFMQETLVKKHVTNFYFSKGFVHTTLGFEIGQYAEEVNVLGLKMLLGSIPGYYPFLINDVLREVGDDKKTEEIMNQNETAYFIFTTPDINTAKNDFNSSGSMALATAIELISEETPKNVRRFPENVNE